MIGKKIGTGRTAEVYEWSDNQVIRLCYPSVSLEEAQREFEVHRLLQEKVPFCVEVYGTQKVEDRIGILYEKVHGESLSSMIFKNPDQIMHYGQIMAATHKSLHSIDFSRLPSLKEALSHIIRHSSHLEERTKEMVLEVLFTLPDGEAICHMDFHPENIYLSGERVTILDWMTAAKGHPLADVARTEMILKYAVIPGVPEDLTRQMKVAREELLRGYHETYFPEGISAHDAGLLKSFEIVLLAARLSENLPRVEVSEIEKVLLRQIAKTMS